MNDKDDSPYTLSNASEEKDAEERDNGDSYAQRDESYYQNHMKQITGFTGCKRKFVGSNDDSLVFSDADETEKCSHYRKKCLLISSDEDEDEVMVDVGQVKPFDIVEQDLELLLYLTDNFF